MNHNKPEVVVFDRIKEFSDKIKFVEYQFNKIRFLNYFADIVVMVFYIWMYYEYLNPDHKVLIFDIFMVVIIAIAHFRMKIQFIKSMPVKKKAIKDLYKCRSDEIKSRVQSGLMKDESK